MFSISLRSLRLAFYSVTLVEVPASEIKIYRSHPVLTCCIDSEQENQMWSGEERKDGGRLRTEIGHPMFSPCPLTTCPVLTPLFPFSQSITIGQIETALTTHSPSSILSLFTGECEPEIALEEDRKARCLALQSHVTVCPFKYQEIPSSDIIGAAF